VRGHGGRLELLRSDEAGTAFTIHLPKAVIALEETSA
jgi:C4-dicarboxylate-specific signal transduction histidine kinase